MGMSSPPTQLTNERDPLSFEGRVAVVTGSGSGVGRAHALLLGQRGASVVVNDLPVPHGAGDSDGIGGLGPAHVVAEEIRVNGGTAIACELDLTAPGAAKELIEAAVQQFGRVDIVINNAGVLRAVDFEDMTAEVFDFVLGVNLRATFLVSQAAWPLMLQQNYGRILSTTSNSGLLGTAGSTAYAAAKAGVWGLTRSLALEGRDHGINVNAIAPIAFTAMSMTSRIAPPSWRSGEGDEWAHRLDPALISPAAAWLVHEDCTLNGQVLSVAGGRVARFFMGLTEGFASDTLTIEDVRDGSDGLFKICPESGLFVNDEPFQVLPRALDEGKKLRRRLLG
jgi:NAD(P)-dependent dehydrogenase (short-subunit alcohol dehydrogenase family)